MKLFNLILPFLIIYRIKSACHCVDHWRGLFDGHNLHHIPWWYSIFVMRICFKGFFDHGGVVSRLNTADDTSLSKWKNTLLRSWSKLCASSRRNAAPFSNADVYKPAQQHLIILCNIIIFHIVPKFGSFSLRHPLILLPLHMIIYFILCFGLFFFYFV